MAKALFGGAGGAPRTTMNGSPGGVRPMPRPVAGAAPPAQQGGILAQFLGPQGSDDRTDMALQFLKAAMSSAPDSGSGALQFLAPILSGVIGARATKLNDDKKAAEVTGMTESLLGPNGMTPQAKRALEIMNNENAPDYLRALAKKQFESATVPIDSAPARRRSGGGSGGGTGAAPATGGGSSTRVYGAPFDINGVLHQRDAYGNAVPMKGPDGKPVPAPGKGGASAAAPVDDPLGYRTNPTEENPLEMP